MDYRAVKEVLGYDIVATAIPVGADWHATVTGGCAPHIGSTSFAWQEGATVRVEYVARGTHKDHIVGNQFAAEMARALNTAVSVDCGIHYENLSPDEIKEVVAGSEQLLHLLLKKLPPLR